MRIFKKQFIILFFIALLGNNLFAQKETSDDALIPPAEWTVRNHKDQLKLTLIIDSIQLGKKVHKVNFQREINLDFESDYLQVKDDIYIKIFISRNQEYGKKFYSWKWDYLKKTGDRYNKLNSSYYTPMDYNQPIPANGGNGQGTGYETDPDYLMIYYRYKLE